MIDMIHIDCIHHVLRRDGYFMGVIGITYEQSAMNVTAVKMLSVMICGVDIEALVDCMFHGVAFVTYGINCEVVVVGGLSEY